MPSLARAPSTNVRPSANINPLCTGKTNLLHTGSVPLTSFGLATAFLAAPTTHAWSGMIASVSFWLAVLVAVTGAVLSLLSIGSAVSAPRSDPYFYAGQWFVWCATLFSGTVVAISLVFPSLRPWDLLAITVSVWLARRTSNFVCALQWRKQPQERIPARLETSV